MVRLVAKSDWTVTLACFTIIHLRPDDMDSVNLYGSGCDTPETGHLSEQTWSLLVSFESLHLVLWVCV